jgi:archaeal type IV pilus assembly protein PilA
MHYAKRQMSINREDAVSPVVGVMLMLVVTIIIAAVVSAFAGGLFGSSSNQRTPTVAMEASVVNNSGVINFTATVLSVSDPVPTKNLVLSSTWISGKSYGGGNSSTKIPYGYGPGVTGTVSLESPTGDQSFGNFTLTQGTGLVVPDSDIKTLLGNNSHNLTAGDTVTFRLVYTPTGKTVWQQNVVVKDGV